MVQSKKCKLPNIPQCYFVRSLYTVWPILLLTIILISRNSHLYVQKPAANIITNLTLTWYAFSHTVWKDFIFYSVYLSRICILGNVNASMLKDSNLYNF